MISYLRSAHPALKLGVACASFGALAAFGQLGASAAAKSSAAQGNAEALAAVPPAFRFAPVDPVTAERMNAAQPVEAALLNAARPFVLTGGAGDRARALKCLTEAVYYEAATEPLQGRRAVAQVVLNRVRHPLFPHSVCGVVYQGASLGTGCQFSFVCDGSMQRGRDESAWAAARDVARAALNGAVEPAVGEATHYHATYVAPYWAPTVAKVAHIGLHIFYRWSGLNGLPSAFTAQYAAVERIPFVKPHVAATPLQLASAPEAEVAAARLEPAVLSVGAGSAAPATAPVTDGRVHLVLDAEGYAAPARTAFAAPVPALVPSRAPTAVAPVAKPAALTVVEVGQPAAKPAEPAVTAPAKPAITPSPSIAAVALNDGPLAAHPAA